MCQGCFIFRDICSSLAASSIPCGTRSPRQPRARRVLSVVLGRPLPPAIASYGAQEQLEGAAASKAAAGYLYCMKTGSPCLPNGLSVPLPCLATSHLGESLREGRGAAARSKAGDFPLFAALALFLFVAERAVCTADALFITLLQGVVAQP